MLLSREEFLNVKPELVADVVVKLKNLARLEAELLFREFSNYPGALPHFRFVIESIDRINAYT